MKLKRLAALACAALVFAASAVSCSKDAWQGYEKSDLSKYVKVGQYKGLNVLLNTELITEDEINYRIDQELVAARYEEEITDRPVEIGDHVKFDYTGTIDGEADLNFSGKDIVVQIGTNAFHSQLGDIESAFIGHSAGDVFTVNGTFPENYMNFNLEDSASYVGKTITFEITLNKVFDLIIPELNDEFVKSVSTVSTTVEEYKEEIKNILIEERKENIEQQKVNGAWGAVMSTVEVIEYPKSEVDAMIKSIEESYLKLAQNVDSSMTLENYVTGMLGMTMDQFNEQTQQYAHNSVTELLALYYIARQENISVTDEEYENLLAEYSEKYGFTSSEELESYYGEELIRQSMLFDKVIKLVIENATFTEAAELEQQSGDTA